MAKTGRPSTITPAALKKLENAFRVGATIQEALGVAEVSRKAFERYCQKNPEFRGKIKQWQGQITLSAKTIIARAIRNDNVQMAMKLLELEEKKEARREYARRWRSEQRLNGDAEPEQQKTPSGFMTQFLTELNGEDSGDEQQNT
jgi:hypothetical protein